VSSISSSEQIAADWLGEGRRVVGATLVERIGSAPLDPGAQMLIDDRANIEGSVTGGCVEAALVEEAGKILAGERARVVTYGVSDEEAAGVGLMCGGTVRVFVHEYGGDSLPAHPLAAVELAGVPRCRQRAEVSLRAYHRASHRCRADSLPPYFHAVMSAAPQDGGRRPCPPAAAPVF